MSNLPSGVKRISQTWLNSRRVASVLVNALICSLEGLRTKVNDPVAGPGSGFATVQWLRFESFSLTKKCPASPVLQDGVKGHNMMKPSCRKALSFRAGSFTIESDVKRYPIQFYFFQTVTV
jgi:hypothetical protein